MSIENQEKIIEKLKNGVFARDASNRYTYESWDVPGNRYYELRKRVVKEFKLIPFGFTMGTSDEIFKTYLKGLNRIGIEWDIWSGFIVVAKNRKVEELVHKIGLYLETII